MTKRELLDLGETIFEGLKSGTLAIENATDQAAIEHKSYETIEDIVGIVLHGQLPHEFQVAVVEAWLGSSQVWERSSEAASVTLESYRELFFAELLRLVPHEPDPGPIVTSRPPERLRSPHCRRSMPAVGSCDATCGGACRGGYRTVSV